MQFLGQRSNKNFGNVFRKSKTSKNNRKKNRKEVVNLRKMQKTEKRIWKKKI